MKENDTKKLIENLIKTLEKYGETEVQMEWEYNKTHKVTLKVEVL